ncbi:hypothetical protein IC229_30090 [Spirosoma sp. BT702]|uniref:Uncharacterized protein n=1 Tax=Spirosoma profusum TaxID=2771354 RepID=A0A927AV19_9BACT|nr:hypothetical protein [Spirosoma profusum]MBD2704921.1 hypothetical protein [Spirosoma profusum]
MRTNRNYLQILYLGIGIASLLFFAWTGRYLRTTYPDKQAMDMGLRIMLRSRHIFILLVSLMEVGIGLYIEQAKKPIAIFLQWVATTTLLAAHGLFVYAFFYEVDPIYVPQTPILHKAAYLIVASVIMHILVRLEPKS